MNNRSGSLPWRALLILAPICWLTGSLMERLPGFVHSFLLLPAQDQYVELLVMLIGTLVSAAAVGWVLSVISETLGPARLRALLDVRRACLFGALAAALLWVCFTGLIWADFTGEQFAVYVWRILLGASYDLFVLVWLILGVRAAAARVPMRAGVTLLSGATTSFFAGVGVLMLILPLLYDLEPSLPLFGLFVFFVVTILFVPPALLTAGMAAVFAGMRQSKTTSGGEGTTPPTPPEA